MKSMKIVRRILTLFAFTGGLLWIWLKRSTLKVKPIQLENVVKELGAPLLQSGQVLKVMSYNVQFMAGGGYQFFYEGGDSSGPSAEVMGETIKQVAQVITAEQPDIVLLQEIDEGAKRTHFVDQLARLLNELDGQYPCYTQSFYWRADFVPHPAIAGAVGMKMVILSKYQIGSATRYALPLRERNWFVQHFFPKRALLEVRLPLANGREIALINTHFEALKGKTDISEQEVAVTQTHLQRLTAAGIPWLLGGDLNLLPPGQWERIGADSQKYYRPEPELRPLYEQFQAAVPAANGLADDQLKKWFSLIPNDPQYTAPVVTLDHFFISPDITLQESYIRHEDTYGVSDHLPIVATIQLPEIE